MVLFLERFASQLQGFGDGRSGDRSPPLPDNLVPVHSLSHLLEHLRDPYPGAPKGWLTAFPPQPVRGPPDPVHA